MACFFLFFYYLGFTSRVNIWILTVHIILLHILSYIKSLRANLYSYTIIWWLDVITTICTSEQPTSLKTLATSSTTSTMPPTTQKTIATSSTTSTSKSITMKIIAAGGTMGEATDLISTVEYFNPYAVENRCDNRNDYPRNVTHVCGDKELFCGGYDNILTGQCYRLEGTKWTQRANLINSRSSGSCMYLSNSSFLTQLAVQSSW